MTDVKEPTKKTIKKLKLSETGTKPSVSRSSTSAGDTLFPIPEAGMLAILAALLSSPNPWQIVPQEKGAFTIVPSDSDPVQAIPRAHNLWSAVLEYRELRADLSPTERMLKLIEDLKNPHFDDTLREEGHERRLKVAEAAKTYALSKTKGKKDAVCEYLSKNAARFQLKTYRSVTENLRLYFWHKVKSESPAQIQKFKDALDLEELFYLWFQLEWYDFLVKHGFCDDGQPVHTKLGHKDPLRDGPLSGQLAFLECRCSVLKIPRELLDQLIIWRSRDDIRIKELLPDFEAAKKKTLKNEAKSSAGTA